jgi:hypothetical protein
VAPAVEAGAGRLGEAVQESALAHAQPHQDGRWAGDIVPAIREAIAGENESAAKLSR